MTTNRRDFLQNLAVGAGGLAVAASMGKTALSAAAQAPSPAKWADHIGLELFSVRDDTAKDYLGTLAKVAQIGYKEVEPDDYGNMSPRTYRAALDRLGLTAPSTHGGITAGAADVETQLAGFQIMGIQYTSLGLGRPPGGRGRAGAARGGPAGRGRATVALGPNKPATVESVKREAGLLNQYGKIGKKFGIKMLRHNHTTEFTPCAGTTQLPYSILLSETDPDLVVFQMDIGLLVTAGQDPVEWFHRSPGRFALWHVKDVINLKSLPPVTNEAARLTQSQQVPIGTGEIDYKTIFGYAALAGLKHFDVEQRTAVGPWGDSIGAATLSYKNLHKMLA